MACDTLHSGSQFLATALSNLDCQGRTIGSYGYGALADPGSSVSHALTGILAIFIALFGIRLLMGDKLEGRDLVGAAIKVGLFLTLATSWPAWRIIGYDLVMDGPAQIAGRIGAASGLPGSADDLAARLQDADNAVVALTMYGSGRLTGGVSVGADLGDATSGIALADQFALGTGRAAFLGTVLGSAGLLKLAAGILLALAPLMAGLLLFTGTMGLFLGWIRGLVFCALGGAAFHLIAGAELALLYPWLQDVLGQRQMNRLLPSAPTELLVLAVAFAVITVGALYVIAKITFLPAIHMRSDAPDRREAPQPGNSLPPRHADDISERTSLGRAEVIASAVAATIQREERGSPDRIPDVRRGDDRGPAQSQAPGRTRTTDQQERLGATYRRSTRRISAAARRRDQI